MKISIVWGWAAGMMVWARLVEIFWNKIWKQVEIFLFEANAGLWKKVIISWGWRCNLTNWNFDKNFLLSKYIRWADFLKHHLWVFWPKKIIQFFEENGLKTKIEKDNRVFPISNDWKDVVKMFENIFSDKIEIFYKTKIENIEKKDQKFVLTFGENNFETDILVLTTGWNAYSHTGSKWDWYNFAKNLWHWITKLWPSLNSFELQEEWVKNLSWISLQASFEINWKKISGPMIFTHFGISGPLVFELSAHLSFEDIKNKTIHLIPSEKNFETWEKIFQNFIEKNWNQTIENILNQYFPKRFVFEFLNSLDMIDKRLSNLSKTSRQKITKLLWFWIPCTIKSRRAGDEFVTAWWIKLDEINKKNLESKICENLYFAGEILDIDWATGWFNLTACWATGYWVANAIWEKLIKNF